MSRPPLALFTAGAVGAGKSVLAEMVQDRHALVSLDADHILVELMRRRPRRCQESLRPLALRLLNHWQDMAIAQGASLLVNTTAANLLFVTRHRERLERTGYRTAMVFVAADEAACRHRNRARPLPRPLAAEAKFLQIHENLPSLESQFGHFLLVENRTGLADFRSRIAREVLPWVGDLA